MNALQERVEVRTCALADYEFSVQHKFARRQGQQSGNDLRKIASQRLTSLGLQNDFVTLAKSEAAKAIPFGLIEPAGSAREVFYRLGFSRRVRRLQWKVDLGKSVFQRFR